MSAPGERPDLGALREEIWQELSRACTERTHPWRAATLATHSEQGPQARVVIVREVWPQKAELAIYTDTRAGKVQQLQQDPRACLVMWWPERGWQLRLQLKVQVHTDGLAVASRWARLRHHRAAQDYLSPLAPGQALNPPPSAHTAPPHAMAAHDRSHFGVLMGQVLSLDWLSLSEKGHQRAQFELGHEGQEGLQRWVQA